MKTLSPAARKLYNQLKPKEKEYLKLRARNPISAVKYVVEKYGVGLRVAKEVVDSFR